MPDQEHSAETERERRCNKRKDRVRTRAGQRTKQEEKGGSEVKGQQVLKIQGRERREEGNDREGEREKALSLLFVSFHDEWN